MQYIAYTHALPLGFYPVVYSSVRILPCAWFLYFCLLVARLYCEKQDSVGIAQPKLEGRKGGRANRRGQRGAVVYREHITLGETHCTAHEVQEIISDMGRKYKGNAYHLLQQNCNHFSDELCMRLTGQHAPLWVSAVHSHSSLQDCLGIIIIIVIMHHHKSV